VSQGRFPVLGSTAARAFRFRIPDHLITKLEELARASGEKPSAVVRRLIAEAEVRPGTGEERKARDAA
jgi:hypothetical protein